MRRHATRWIAWRLTTGQINEVTAKGQRYSLAYFCDAMGNRQPAQIGVGDLERWRTDMVERLSPATIRTRWSVANNFLEWLVDEGKMKCNPARRLPRPKVPRAVHRNLRPDQSQALHDACIDSRERLIVALDFQLGMRRTEIARVEIGDFDFVERSVRVVGKGGHERVIALTIEVERALVDYLMQHRIHAGPLIRSLDGRNKGLTPGYIGELFEKIAYRAGVKTRPWDGVGTHSGRHTAATDVAHRTGNAMVVRDFLGHASLDTTQRYVDKVDLESQRTAIEGRRYAS